jgi:hypothetical protein
VSHSGQFNLNSD